MFNPGRGISDLFLMPNTVTNKQVCSGCGVEVRPNNDYCYNCGTFVGTERGPAVEQTVASDNGKELSGVVDDKRPLRPGEIVSKRRHQRPPKRVERKPYEIVWGEPDDAPKTTFYVAAGVLILFAVIAVMVMSYFK